MTAEIPSKPGTLQLVTSVICQRPDGKLEEVRTLGNNAFITISPYIVHDRQPERKATIVPYDPQTGKTLPERDILKDQPLQIANMIFTYYGTGQSGWENRQKDFERRKIIPLSTEP